MTAPATILSLATKSPSHHVDQHTVLATARDIMTDRLDSFERMASVFVNAGVRHRQLAPGRTVPRAARLYRAPAHLSRRRARSFRRCRRAGVERCGTSARRCRYDRHGVVDRHRHASLEARSLQRMAFRSDVARVPVFGLGCAGAVTGLALASKLVDKADVISAALFGDGAAACVLRAGDEGFATVSGVAETTWPNSLDIMGWQLEPDGLGVILNRAIPVFARRHLRPAMAAMLARQSLAIEDVDRFICHPGGAKVIDAIEGGLSLDQGSLDAERDVLRDHGNMSAPTALFVLDRIRAKAMPPCGVMTAFGPGFTVSAVTLRAAA